MGIQGKEVLENFDILKEAGQHDKEIVKTFTGIRADKSLKIDKLLSRFRVHDKSKTNNNAPGLYLDYRKVFSRFIHSYGYQDKESILKSLEIYDNEKGNLYKIQNPLNEDVVNRAFLNYIRNCMIQEYTWGNIKKVNQIMNHHQNPLKIRDNFLLFIKNNLGIGYFKNRWRK